MPYPLLFAILLWQSANNLETRDRERLLLELKRRDANLRLDDLERENDWLRERVAKLESAAGDEAP